MLEDTSFVLIWMALPFFWHYLLKAACLSLWRLTIPTVVILAFYVYQYIGLPLLYFHLDEFRVDAVNDKWVLIQVFFYTALTMTLMIFGYIAGRRFFGALKWVGATKVRESSKIQIICLLVLCGVCFSVLLLYLSRVGIEKIALLTVFGFGDDIQAEVARSAMGNSFEGKYHWYYLFMNKLLLFCAYAIFVQYLLKKNLRNRLLFSLVFLVTTFSMIMSIEKGPMANFLISLFLVYVLVRKEGIVPLNGVVYLGVALMAVLALFYMGFMGTKDPAQAFFYVASRAFTGQIQPAYHYLEYFPYHHDFLLGLSFPNPGGILPFEPFYLTEEIMAWYNPSQADIGVVGSMPTVYWGEMYANFGFPGVVLPPFFVGFVLYWLNSLALKLSLDPLVIALFVWFMMHLINLSGTSLSGFFVDTYGLITLFVFFLIAFISGGGIVKLQRKFSEKQNHFNNTEILLSNRETFDE